MGATLGNDVNLRDFEGRSALLRLRKTLANPLVILLTVLSIISFATGDPRAGTVGDAADFMDLYRCTGVPMYRDEAVRLERPDEAELLRRRMFEAFPKGAAECDKYVTAFWHRMQTVEPARATALAAGEYVAI